MTLLRRWINVPLGTRRCWDIESTPYWPHDVVATSNQLPTGHTTLLRRWFPLGTRRCCDVESASHWAHDVVVTLNQRPTGHTALLRRWINVPLGTRRCCDIESTSHWAHDVVATSNQSTAGHTTLLRHWINVPLGTRRHCDVESTLNQRQLTYVDSTSQQRRVPSGNPLMATSWLLAQRRRRWTNNRSISQHPPQQTHTLTKCWAYVGPASTQH